jgi:hypothetical protein
MVLEECCMTGDENEVVPSLTVADVKVMVDQVLTWTDGNHPEIDRSESGFMDILQNGESRISASSVFIRKIAG